jgi:hypothetical protein
MFGAAYVGLEVLMCLVSWLAMHGGEVHDEIRPNVGQLWPDGQANVDFPVGDAARQWLCRRCDVGDDNRARDGVLREKSREVRADEAGGAEQDRSSKFRRR